MKRFNLTTSVPTFAESYELTELLGCGVPLTNGVVTLQDVFEVMTGSGSFCCMDNREDRKRFLSALVKYARYKE